MITSGDLTNGLLFIKKIKIDETNGWWCEQCECYHPYDYYNKLSGTTVI